MTTPKTTILSDKNKLDYTCFNEKCDSGILLSASSKSNNSLNEDQTNKKTKLVRKTSDKRCHRKSSGSSNEKDAIDRVAEYLNCSIVVSTSNSITNRARRHSEIRNSGNYQNDFDCNLKKVNEKGYKSSNDRKSRTGVTPNICKNGGGGKFTWGKPGIEWVKPSNGIMGNRDPNYDEYKNEVYYSNNFILTDAEIIKPVKGPFQEYLINNDDQELLEIFKTFDTSVHNISRLYFYLLIWGLESNKKSHRGHVWQLFYKTIKLQGKHFSNNDALFKALEDFFDARRELIVDCPNFDEYVQKFLACLIYKFGHVNKSSDIDLFLKREIIGRAEKFGRVVNVAYSIVSRIKSDYDILSTIWTIDGYLTTEQLSYELSKIVADWYYDGYSAKSLVQDLTSSIKTPHYYHELIYQILIKAMTEGKDHALTAAINTIKVLVYKNGIVSKSQVNSGFLRIFNEMDDLTIDIPKSANLLAKLVNMSRSEDLIDDLVRIKMPRLRGDRRRAMSERCWR